MLEKNKQTNKQTKQTKNKQNKKQNKTNKQKTLVEKWFSLGNSYLPYNGSIH